MADDKKTVAFDNPLGPALEGTTTLGLDLSYLVPKTGDDDQYKLLVSGLPDGVTPSKGKIDSDRNWSLTMAQTTGITITVESIGSVTNLLEAMTFEVIDVDTGTTVHTGEADLNSFNDKHATITIDPVGSELLENAGGLKESASSEDVNLIDLDTPLQEEASLKRHDDSENEVSKSPENSGVEGASKDVAGETATESVDLEAAAAHADSDNNIGTGNQTLQPLAQTTDPVSTPDAPSTQNQDVTHNNDSDDNAGNNSNESGNTPNVAPTDISVSGSTVQENSAAGTVVGIASAVDSDAGETFTYSLSDDAGGLFTINPATGEISVADGAVLDFEDAASHGITIQVTDSAGNVYSETMTIDVSDVNEAATDISLSASSVAENSAGAVVGTLSSTDPDTGDSHTYSVDDGRFEVVGGQLKLKSGQSLDHETADTVTVNVTTTDSGGLTRTEAFDISVTDVNEVATDISLSASSVAENSAGAVVGTLSTTDADAGDSHTYTVDDSRFEVVGGQLKLKAGQSLDHESADTVTVNVTTTDSGGLTRTEAFDISVTDVNEAATDISLSNASVNENASGAVVGTLSTTDADAGDSHTYTVDDSRFEVVGGQLKLKSGQSLDHETADTVTVNVTTTDSGGLTRTEAFDISVTDVNEVATDISLSASSVAENSAGAVVGTLSSTDPDAGDSHTYTVDDNRFEVVGGQLKLKSGVSLDYETADTVTVNVTTTDSGGLTRTEAFDISVTDVNEVATDISLSASSVAENSAGAVVGTLSSTDPDAGDSHTYTVDDSRFEVVGGQLKLKAGQSLDHESADTVTVNVTTTDSGGLTRTEAFDISVTDVNEVATDISLSNASVNENASGAVVGTLTSTDPDAGDSHTYTVDDNRFEVVGGQLKLKAGQSLDHESADTVTVNVTTTDSGGLTRTEAFDISVTDVNEVATDISLSASSVAENASGAVVGTLTSTDPDAGDSHTYTVDDNRFEVVGGQLKLKSGVSLDHETADTVTVNVTTTDSGGLTRTEAFDISVTDVNEVATDISLSNASVNENASGAVVGTLSTTDADAGDSHTYTVDDSRFEVVGGQLKLKAGQSLDQESADTVTVNVTTTDSGGLTRTEAFDISVTDVNEAATDINLSANSVSENWHNQTIGTLSVTDVDDGDSHTYTVDDSRFEVVSGQLRLKSGQSLDHETEPTVTVNITATDSGGATYTEAMTINVTDIYERPAAMTLTAANPAPVDADDQSPRIAENSDGAVVGTITTYDVDDGDSHTYTVNDSRFEVVSGQLKLKSGQSLDYETESSLSLEVTATDAGGRTYTQSFTVNVTDVTETTSSTIAGTANAETITGTSADEMILGAGSTAVTTGSNLITNGSFEANGGSTDGWTVSGTAAQIKTSGTHGVSSSDGSYHVDLDASPGNTTLQQSVSGLSAGTTYQLSFEASDYEANYALDASLEVYWNGELVSTVEPGTTTMQTYTFNVEGGSGDGTDTLEFREVGVVDYGGTNIDNVSLFEMVTEDTINAGAGNDVVYGGSGNDYINGEAGDDTLSGGAGLDRLSGGAGNDTFNVSGDGYTRAGVHTYSNSHGDSIEIQSKSVVLDQIYGGDGWDTIEGTAGDDVLNLSLGTTNMDSIDGTALRIDSIEEVNLGAGDDILDMDSGAVSYSTDMTVDGGSGNDNLWMADGDDTVFGGTGNDRITGHDGNDTIEGGEGTDSMDGGAGTDTLSYATSSLAVNVNLGTGAASGGDATGDTFSNFENLTGSANADTLTGDANNNVIEGGAGADIMDGGAGTDTLSYAGSSTGVAVDMSTGTASRGDAAGDTFLNFENLLGSSNNDTLTGDSNVNTISGGAGDDTITGGGGNDILDGGTGNDRIIVTEQGGGTVTARGGSGWVDTLELQNSSGGDATDGWTITLTTGTVHSDDGDTMSLSDDAAGTITLDDGTQIAFEGMERIEY